MARGRPTVAFIADLTKHAFVGQLIAEPEIDLRVPPGILQQLDDRETQHHQRLPYVEKTLAPQTLDLDDEHTVFQLGVSNYARFMAAAELFNAYSLDEQRHEFSQHDVGTPPWFAHSLGVNCSLETSDGKLLWTIRPSAVLENDLLAPVMGEGARVDDVIDGTWIPETTARRGFHEELGFRLDSENVLQLTFHSVVAQFNNGGHSVSGHAITTLTLQQVLEQHHDAIDADEHVNGIYVCDTNAESLEAFIEAHPLNEWTTWGTGVLWDLTTHRLDMNVEGLELQPLAESEIITT